MSSHAERISKNRVIERLCSLANEVGEAHEYQLAHDCFCGFNTLSNSDDYRFEVLEFIEEAVRENLVRLKVNRSDEQPTDLGSVSGDTK